MNGLCFLITRPIAPATAGSLIIRQTKPKRKIPEKTDLYRDSIIAAMPRKKIKQLFWRKDVS